MAYIQQRGEFWRVEIRKRGHKPIYQTCDTLKEAEKRAREIETEIDAGSYVDKSEARRITLRQALEKYRKEIVPTKRHPYQENKRIDRWLKNDLAYKTLAALRGADFAQYRGLLRGMAPMKMTLAAEQLTVSAFVGFALMGEQNISFSLKLISRRFAEGSIQDM